VSSISSGNLRSIDGYLNEAPANVISHGMGGAGDVKRGRATSTRRGVVMATFGTCGSGSHCRHDLLSLCHDTTMAAMPQASSAVEMRRPRV
jgi:hypothetical protein